MNTVKLVAVFAENKPGQTARITKILSAAQINIRCITVASSGAYGVMKLLVNNPEQASLALKHEGFAATLMDVVAVEMPDKPGALYAVADCLAQHGVNVENTSGFVANNRAILVIEAHDVAKACQVLEAEKMHVLSQAETLAI
ncbi:MAG TPA: ACT domain-containing protein [Verrucomicrobiae bacterium]|nr:ACT domain-containing protein [Verrucomicrobiae bacterium]